MIIDDLQFKEEGPWPEMEKLIENITRQWNEGTTSEVSYHSQMALLYGNMKNVEEVRKHAALVPDNAKEVDQLNVIISLARMLIYEDKVEEAIPYYARALEMCPDHDMALIEIAECYSHLKQYTEAEKWYKVAIDYEPDTSCLWQGAGIIASHQQKYEEAIEYFNKAIAFDKYKNSIYYNEYCLGLCYDRLKDFYRALAHYKKCLDDKPTFAHALNNIANLYYEHEADIKTALDYMKQAEAIAAEEDDNALLQQVYINLIRLYGMIKEFDLQQLYNNKLLEVLGFGFGFLEDDDDE